jgi:hypothetical protein
MAIEFPEYRKKWAILVGVNTYKHVSPLQFCKNDATELANLLQTSLGFGKDDVLRLTEDSPGFEPTYVNLIHYLGEIKEKRNVAEDDLLVFFFSGHGMMGKDDNKDYLLPIDATPHNLVKTGLTIEYVAQELKDTTCKNIVMLIDACRDPLGGAKSVTSLGDDAVDAVKRAGIVTIFACDPKLKSYEIDKLNHGSFTHCILEAINNGKGKTIATLYEFLKDQVPATNAQYLKPYQIPYGVIEPPEKGGLPIFFSKQALTDFALLLARVGDLRRDEVIDNEWTNKIVEFLTTTSSGGRDPGKIGLVDSLCSGSLTFIAFKTVWDSFDRSRTPSGKVQKLEPLQKVEPLLDPGAN